MFIPLIVMFSILLSACLGPEDEEILPAQYGDIGAQWAIDFAQRYPKRLAYSYQEQQAGEMIYRALVDLGYEVEVQSFTGSDGQGQSANYIVRIPGEGFMSQREDDTYIPTRRTVIVGAHYDTPGYSQNLLTEQVLDDDDEIEEVDRILYDGLQNNASGVACLLTIADQVQNMTFAYDVIIIAFGASSDDFAGARAFLNNLTFEEMNSIDVMYCIESIYAGDKLYASAGHNSLEPGKKYERRRKLYEAYDVVYNNMLRSRNNVDLLYNMSGLIIDVNGNDQLDIYREVTMTRSDYVPFDDLGIPIVFFESYDYNYSRFEDMKETRNLNLQSEGGHIRATVLDASEILLDELGMDLLVARINNTAFIIIESILRGSHNLIAQSEYERGERFPVVQEDDETQKDAGLE